MCDRERKEIKPVRNAVYKESEIHIEGSREIGSVFKQGYDIIKLVFEFF